MQAGLNIRPGIGCNRDLDYSSGSSGSNSSGGNGRNYIHIIMDMSFARGSGLPQFINHIKVGRLNGDHDAITTGSRSR